MAGDEEGADLRFVAAQFGLGRPRAVAVGARGAMGEIYRLDTDTGVYAVKRLLWEVPEESAAEREVAFAQLCGTVGVPSPRVLRTAEGAILLPAGSADTAWRVAEWVEGSTPARLDPAVATWLAGVAGRIHRLADPTPGVLTDPWYLRVDHRWDVIAARATAAGVAWAPRLRSRLRELGEAATWVSSQPEGRSVRCHRDLKADNTLRTAEQRWVLLDWDNVGPLAPWREMGTLLVHWWRRPDVLAQLTRTYRQAGGPPYPAGASVFASGMAQWLNFLGAQAAVLLDPGSVPADREFARPRVTGLLRDIPTLADLEQAAKTLP